ncbi:D-glycero-alpha-D-manno-heptose 1-phosphate guanylyltransferase [compost metagenome]
MAGGLGTRLGELTKSTPKPMLKVGDKPLLETIVRNFLDQGFKNFYFAVNYMAEVIEDHFGDGEKFGAQIRYLRENKRLGTAGALSLIPEMPTEPLIVANGDLLADIDYSHMLDMHVDTEAVATMGVSEYEFQIPYGVVHEQGGDISHIEEKPAHKSLISAGIYVLSPAALELVPKDQFFDMPTLFEQMIDHKMRSRVYQVHGYWLDIGRLPDYQKANSDISRVFQ